MVIQRGWLFGVHRIRVQGCGCGNLGCKACCAPQILLTWPTFIDIYDTHFDMTMMWHLCGIWEHIENLCSQCVPKWETLTQHGNMCSHVGECIFFMFTYTPRHACSHVFPSSHIGEHLSPCS